MGDENAKLDQLRNVLLAPLNEKMDFLGDDVTLESPMEAHKDRLKLYNRVSYLSIILMEALNELMEWKNEIMSIEALPTNVMSRFGVICSKICRGKGNLKLDIETLLDVSRRLSEGFVLNEELQRHQAALASATRGLEIEKLKNTELQKKLDISITQTTRLRCQHRLFKWHRLSTRLNEKHLCDLISTQRSSLDAKIQDLETKLTTQGEDLAQASLEAELAKNTAAVIATNALQHRGASHNLDQQMPFFPVAPSASRGLPGGDRNTSTSQEAEKGKFLLKRRSRNMALVRRLSKTKEDLTNSREAYNREAAVLKKRTSSIEAPEDDVSASLVTVDDDPIDEEISEALEAIAAQQRGMNRKRKESVETFKAKEIADNEEFLDDSSEVYAQGAFIERQSQLQAAKKENLTRMRKDSRLQKETKLLGTVCISTEPEAKPRRGSRPLEVTSESSSRESTPRAPFRPRAASHLLYVPAKKNSR